MMVSLLLSCQEMFTTVVDHPVMSTDERRTSIGGVALLFQRLASFVHRRMCALRGHDMMLEFAPKRLSLRCAACGAHTPGWELNVKMRPVARLPRIRVLARTAPAVMKAVPLPASSHATDHASAA